MTNRDDGVHDPAERQTVPTDETPEERQRRLDEAEQDVTSQQQRRADKRNKDDEDEGKTYTGRKDLP